MEKLITLFPEYKPDQFLTSYNLNSSFNYLDQQERLTRAKLTGSGIVAGFGYQESQSGGQVNSIKLNSGCGLTTDGYLMIIPEDESYSHWVKFEDMPLTGTEGLDLPFSKGYRLLTAAQAQDDEYDTHAKPVSLALSDLQTRFYLILYLELKKRAVKKCAPGECNTTGTEVEPDVVPVLAEMPSGMPVQKKEAKPMDYFSIQGYRQISKISGEELFRKITRDLLLTNLSLITGKLEELIKESAPYLDPKQADEAAKELKKLKPSLVGTGTSPNQHLIDFERDIVNAINEYIAFFNSSVNAFIQIDPPISDRILVLGGFPYTTGDPCRNYFVPVKNPPSVIAVRQKINVLFRRIFILIRELMPFTAIFNSIKSMLGTNYNEWIRITPSRIPGSPLGKKALPYYYNMIRSTGDTELLRYWDGIPSASSKLAVFNYWDFCSESAERKKMADPFSFDNQGLDFLRIEGHVGLPIETVAGILESKIRNNEMAVKIVSINLESKSQGDIRDKYQLFVREYNQFIGELKKIKVPQEKENLLISYRKKFEVLNMKLNETSYRSYKELKSDMNDLYSFSKMFYVSASGRPPAGTETRKFSFDREISMKVVELMDKHKLLDMRKDILGQVPKETDKTEPVLSDFIGLEYSGGVVRGGTFVILHNGKTVLGDFSLPFIA